MIHKAMGFDKGHWFKCPNDHIYCITECGGAMEKSFCPDCKAEIGGKRSRNEATDMICSPYKPIYVARNSAHALEHQ